MSLSGALQVGRSGLIANQAAIQVTGNNLANVATRGYHRQNITLESIRSQEIQSGMFIGRGVQVQSILRQVDEALESRIRGSISDQAGSAQRQELLSQIESLQNELSDTSLSTQLNDFFNSFSQLANQPLDNSLRSLVVQQGQTISAYLKNLRSGLTDLRTQVDESIDQAAKAANDLLTQIQVLNEQIAGQEKGAGGGTSLRDQRDQLLGELAQYLAISTSELPNGAVDVFVGSLPIILNGRSRGLEVQRRTVDGRLEITVKISADGSELDPTAGKLGTLISSRQSDLNDAINQLDSFTGQLIYQVNRVHSQGQGATGFNQVTADNRVSDTTAALNSEAAGLAFAPTHGSFQIHLTQTSTGQRNSKVINIKLDGIGDQTSLQSLRDQINAQGLDLSASITSDGRLQISPASGDFQISFSDDTSGVLASLGINGFFSGKDALDVSVNAGIRANVGLIATGRNHVQGDNTNALAMAGLRTNGLQSLGGLSLTEAWNRHISDFAIRAGQAAQQNQANTVVRQALEAQQQAVSGVNTDEEAINLMTYQRAYQASARFLSVVDQMYQTLIEML